MIYAGSIVYVEPGMLDEAKKILGGYEQVEIYTVSDDGRQIVVSIEALDDADLERICSEIRAEDPVMEIAHHIFNFEDEVESIVCGEKSPSLDGFFKSGRNSGGNLG